MIPPPAPSDPSSAFLAYWEAARQRADDLATVYGNAQGELSVLDSFGVDRSAERMVTLELEAIAQRRAVLLEIDRLCDLRREGTEAGLGGGSVDSALARAAQAALASSGAGPGEPIPQLLAAAKDLALVSGKRLGRDSGVHRHALRLESMALDLSREVTAFRRQYSSLVPRLPSRYPGQDWSFLSR